MRRNAREVAPVELRLRLVDGHFSSVPGAPESQAEKPKARYRHEWYQTAGAVTVGVLAKRCRPEAVAVAIGPRSLRVDVRDLDAEGQDARVIRRFLDQAAFRARQESGVVMLGRVRPDTISALILWGTANRAGQVALVPVSAVLRGEAD